MRTMSCYLRRLMLGALLAALVYCVIQVTRSEVNLNDADVSNSEKLSRISQMIKESSQQVLYMGHSNGGHGKLENPGDTGEHIFTEFVLVSTARGATAACKLPELDLLNPEIMKFIHDVPALDCGPEDWVVVEGSKLSISDKAKSRYGSITCAFREILRVDDFQTKQTEAHESDDYYILRHSDFVDVRCETKSGKQWHSVLAGVKEDPTIEKTYKWDKVPNTGLKLNVLMFGFDSLSRNTFIRKLPKTYHYLKQNLNALVLEGYNIVGDGTPQALIPILTGKTELELPDTRKRMGSKAQYVDVYPTIWKRYKESGYITGFSEDVPNIGTFTYRLKGFDQQPTDHYMRTWYLAASPYFKYSKKFCIAGQPRHMVMMNYIKTIFDTYRDQPKFMFGFHGELSHDSYNDIGVADDDLHKWVKDLQTSGHLNNTVLIMMSDHGHRFAQIRNTLQGKQEERLPFFAFIFPPWFKQTHPTAYANFVYNTRHLATPFDIHSTLESILKFDTPKEGDIRDRAISLFNKVIGYPPLSHYVTIAVGAEDAATHQIPLERTCADAFIEPHWCACLSWQEVPVDDPTVVLAAKQFVQFLNSYTEEHRNICQVLHLDKILWSAKLNPTKGLLHFRKSGDLDGFLGDFSDKTALTSEVYQVKVKTEPGGGLFEASIYRDVKKNVFKTKISDVSRINKYGSQARCVEQEFHHLRKYCYCKD